MAFLYQSALALGPSKDNVVTATTSLSQAIAACLSKGPFGLGDQLNRTNATVVLAAAQADGRILQPSRTITPIDRSYSGLVPATDGTWRGTGLGGSSQVWVSDSHFAGFNRLWFQVLGIGVTAKIPLVATDFYSAARDAADAASRWDGTLADHYIYPWSHGCLRDGKSTACPGLFAAAGNAVVPAASDYVLLQVAPVLGDTKTILLGEVSKFVPFSPVRFTKVSYGSRSSPYVALSMEGKPGETVTVTCAHTETGQLHRTTVAIGPDGKGGAVLSPHSMWG